VTCRDRIVGPASGGSLAWIHSPPMSEAPETNARIAEVREQLTLLRDYL
jgi:hypothetical protein